jgi:hypothetical protein
MLSCRQCNRIDSYEVKVITTRIYISNSGDDKNDGLTIDAPIFSLARSQELYTGNHEMVLVEGRATLDRLMKEIDAANDWGKTVEGPQGGALPPRR